MNKKVIGAVAAGLLQAGTLQAYDWAAAKHFLTPKEQAFSAAAATAAVGELAKLEAAFDQALDEGWSISELKEMVLQLYAYTGFPRCLNASATLEKVVTRRRAQGKQDASGTQPAAIAAGTDKYALGLEHLSAMSGMPLPSRPAVFIQDTDTFLKEHLFADIFARGVLTYPQRELATVSFLMALGNVNPQLAAHMRLALNVGLTPQQLAGIGTVIKKQLGRKRAVNGLQVLQEVLKK